MSYDPAFGEWVREHLAGLGELRIARMFGAAAVYKDDLMFALIDDDVLWLRADAENGAALREAGAIQFTYPMKGKQMPMSYWSLPDSAADDPDEAVRWARSSIDAAARKAAAKTQKRSGGQSGGAGKTPARG